MDRKKIAIIGTGLIGGSLAIRLHEKKISSRLIGVDSDPVHAALALELELVDEVLPIDEAILQSDVLILAIPVDQMLSLMPAIMNKINHQVIGIGSTIDSLPVKTGLHTFLIHRLRI